MKPIIETARLALREMVPDDLDFVATMLADPEVMRYYPSPLTRDEASAWVELQVRRYDDDGHGLWLALERSSGAPVGQVGLIATEVDGVREPALTYLIHRSYWRRGLATEACLGILDHSFRDLDLTRVITLVRPENLPSLGVARKLGMTPEREVEFKGYKHILLSVAGLASASRPT